MAAVATPPVLTLAAGVGGYGQSRGFRIRPIDVTIPRLPKELEGATIAVISDIHAGKFTDEKVMARIAEAANNLRADLILAPGDIIDFSLSDLPSAIDTMSKMDAAGGVYLCEGNHDLFESREGFEQKVKSAGLGLLINETANLKLRGRNVQIHGLRWGAEGRQTRGRGYDDDAGARENFAVIRDNIDPDAFSIAVAHHPHAFEAAADNGVHLTVAGHTHGGQLMLTEDIGAGPMMFRYWSGLYQKPESSLVVSNGVGNWLPLRINAPAEIVHVTLRSGTV
jgi:predicted MPP superfamily phosphohydrolase